MSSSPTRHSTRRSKLTEKGLANLNQVMTATPILDTTDSRSPADFPLVDETTKKPIVKGKVKGDHPSANSPLADNMMTIKNPNAKGKAKADHDSPLPETHIAPKKNKREGKG